MQNAPASQQERRWCVKTSWPRNRGPGALFPFHVFGMLIAQAAMVLAVEAPAVDEATVSFSLGNMQIHLSAPRAYFLIATSV